MPRKQPESQPLFADDSTDEEAEPISKPQRSGLKKRLSVRVVDPEDGRAPAKTVNINDDAAEKRRRRKSHKIHVVDREDQQQAEGSRQARQRQLRTVAQESQANVQVKLDTYEQWMKLATDNKINAANSWNVALIDYFHDMSLLRNDEDNTINFQRASCTLDGCVKIWTSRVDSVHTETGKLLSNLSNETANDGSEDEDQDDDENGGPSQGKEKKKRKRGGATLAKDYESLQSKKLDLEFNVDPLFKKTSADFDEGGASGLLMNHLSLGLGTDGSMRVVLDASDTMVAVDEDDTSVEEPEKRINFGHLRKFIPDLEDIVERTLCPSLEDFSFHRSAALDDEPVPFYADDIFGDDDDDGFGFGDSAEPNGDEAMDIDGDAPPVPPEVDFFTGADAINEDYGNGGGAWGADEGADGSEENGSREGGSAGPHSAAPGGPGTFVDFDPRQAPNRRDLVMAMSDDAGGALGYFDQSMLKNWAGPEHWKTKRTLRKVDDANKPATKRKTKEKEVFKIDFTTPIEKSHKDIQKELFAPPDKINSLSIPKATKAKETDNLLPDDMHFDARQLVTLFLKPKFTIKMRKHGLSLAAGDDREQVDEAYWARGAAEAAKDNQDVDPDDPFAATQGGGAVPFNTQFLHDDDDDNNAFDLGFDDPFPTMDDLASAAVAREERETNMEEQDLIAATQGQTRRAQAPPVRFAKKAKRVDVRRLKENIWKGLEIIVDESGVAKEHDDEDEDMEPPPTDPAQAPLTNPEEAREFSNVISGLTERYPKDKMEEISTSFCFICLLHLANERGLKLDPGESKIEDDEEQNPSRHDEEDSKAVGNLWDLKIYRDPEAFVDL